MVACRHYEIIGLPASGSQAIIRLSGRLSHNDGEQPSINLLILLKLGESKRTIELLNLPNASVHKHTYTDKHSVLPVCFTKNILTACLKMFQKTSKFTTVLNWSHMLNTVLFFLKDNK